jgi:hypothetical protein
MEQSKQRFEGQFWVSNKPTKTFGKKWTRSLAALHSAPSPFYDWHYAVARGMHCSRVYNLSPRCSKIKNGEISSIFWVNSHLVNAALLRFSLLRDWPLLRGWHLHHARPHESAKTLKFKEFVKLIWKEKCARLLPHFNPPPPQKELSCTTAAPRSGGGWKATAELASLGEAMWKEKRNFKHLVS